MDTGASLYGMTAIVTGGATLFGHGVVRTLSARGARIVVADIDVAGGKEVVHGLSDGIFTETDITDEGSIELCVTKALSVFGSVDILVNLACSYVDDGRETVRSDWLNALDVNVVSIARFGEAVRPHMNARGSGAIVNVSSVSSKFAQAGRWVYPASKAAVVQLTRSMATDYAADGIRVNSVSPGWVWSKPIEEHTNGNKQKANSVAAPFHILRRVGEPTEIGEVVAFLASDDASFVTGADWAVDGGYSSLGPEQAIPAIPKLAQ